jgi:predicted permease
MALNLDWSRYKGHPDKIQESVDALMQSIRRAPGVLSAAASISVPLDQTGTWDRQFQIEGRNVSSAIERPRVSYEVATPDYFHAIGTPLIRGRFFTDADVLKAPQVAVVNQSMARHYWKDQDPLGNRVSFDDGETWITIVGVVGDIHQTGLDRPPVEALYRPLDQAPMLGFSLYVRAVTDPEKLTGQLTSLIHQVDPTEAVSRVRTLDEIRSNSISGWRLTAFLLSIFAVLALAITAAGLAGVTALSVSQRTQEIGIRMALGATPGGIFRMVLGQGLGLVILGVVIGAAGGLGLARLISSLLFGVQPTDALTLVSVALVLLAIAAVSCFLPARRAASVAPMVALRWE